MDNNMLQVVVIIISVIVLGATISIMSLTCCVRNGSDSSVINAHTDAETVLEPLTTVMWSTSHSCPKISKISTALNNFSSDQNLFIQFDFGVVYTLYFGVVIYLKRIHDLNSCPSLVRTTLYSALCCCPVMIFRFNFSAQFHHGPTYSNL